MLASFVGVLRDLVPARDLGLHVGREALGWRSQEVDFPNACPLLQFGQREGADDLAVEPGDVAREKTFCASGMRSPYLSSFT